MAIKIFNTLTRQKEAFEPVTPGQVGMYVCGPTVYSYSHIGHMVGPVIFDTVRRHLAYSGYKVKFVVNVTDIDDKIIVAAAKEGCFITDLTKRVTEDYWDCLRKLDVHVDAFPHATEHVPHILKFIEGLIEKGHAYAVGGDVYFDVTTDRDYGKLSNRKLEEMLAGTRKEVSDLKRNAADFALWKGAKPGEPAWESPWGPGRPGWHIECSAMCRELLGDTFDIHGGGLDLQFPHHEDEIAQSESLTGKPFAKYWMHNGLLYRSGGEGKMSKSLGNAITMRSLFEKYAPEQLRFLILNTHYRSPIDFSEDRIEAAIAGLTRLQALRERIERILKRSFHEIPVPATRDGATISADAGLLGQVAELRTRFLELLDDDFNTGGAIGVLFEIAPLLNKFGDDAKLDSAAASEADRATFEKAVAVFRELTNLLGVFTRASASTAVNEGLAGKLIELLLDLRMQARKNKDFKTSDAIRDRLKALGVVIEDRAEGSTWKIGPAP